MGDMNNKKIATHRKKNGTCEPLVRKKTEEKFSRKRPMKCIYWNWTQMTHTQIVNDNCHFRYSMYTTWMHIVIWMLTVHICMVIQLLSTNHSFIRCYRLVVFMFLFPLLSQHHYGDCCLTDYTRNAHGIPNFLHSTAYSNYIPLA